MPDPLRLRESCTPVCAVLCIMQGVWSFQLRARFLGSGGGYDSLSAGLVKQLGLALVRTCHILAHRSSLTNTFTPLLWVYAIGVRDVFASSIYGEVSITVFICFAHKPARVLPVHFNHEGR